MVLRPGHGPSQYAENTLHFAKCKRIRRPIQIRQLQEIFDHLILVLFIRIRLRIKEKAAPKERLTKENPTKMAQVRGKRLPSAISSGGSVMKVPLSTLPN
jgi:hypothetical protein